MSHKFKNIRSTARVHPAVTPNVAITNVVVTNAVASNAVVPTAVITEEPKTVHEELSAVKNE